jgi:predicted nucleotidyltransferase
MVIKMKTAGIIAEYNPFHNGHAFQIARTRQAGATHIAAVMSGCFTQRGEPAIMPKSARCEAALLCGADLVIELPLPWALASAETFAFGAVYILNALGCVDYLSFGSECGDTQTLGRIAWLTAQIDGSPELASALATGVSFPRARALALAGIATEEDLKLLKNPNDMLAVEYLKALKRLNSPITPVAIKRQSAGHDSLKTGDGFASASYIRRLLVEGRLDEALVFVPERAADIYRREFEKGCAPFLNAVAEPVILSQLRRLQVEDLANLPDVCEGLENRIFSAISLSTGLDELMFRIKTKRYTLSRIRRIISAAFLELSRDYTRNPPPYIRVLGFNPRGAEILGAAKKSGVLPIVTRRADICKMGPDAQRIYDLECLCSDLYGLCLPIRQPRGSEQRYKPLIIKS